MQKPEKPEWISDADWAAVDSPPLTDEELARMRPVIEVAPELIEMARPRGRPPVAQPKVAIKIRLSPDVLARFRATGPGWQTRIDQTLRKALETSDLVTTR